MLTVDQKRYLRENELEELDPQMQTFSHENNPYMLKSVAKNQMLKSLNSMGNYSFGGKTNVKQAKSATLQKSIKNGRKIFNLNNTMASPYQIPVETIGPQKSIYELIT